MVKHAEIHSSANPVSLMIRRSFRCVQANRQIQIGKATEIERETKRLEGKQEKEKKHQ